MSKKTSVLAMAGLLCLIVALEKAADAAPNLGDVKGLLAQAKAGAGNTPEAPMKLRLTATLAARSEKPAEDVAWVSLAAGTFKMGSWRADESPVHEVHLKAFEMSKTPITVAQYAQCVIQGRCSEPASGERCNWGKADRQRDPINCVTWEQANEYAKFKGARLPTEAEWEYAAKSQGRYHRYPWGNSGAACNLAVMGGCENAFGTMPVCSKPEGNSAQGLCDMVGNVAQWTEDVFQGSYEDLPADGSAFEGGGYGRVVRGSAFYADNPPAMEASRRGNFPAGQNSFAVGFRLARSAR